MNFTLVMTIICLVIILSAIVSYHTGYAVAMYRIKQLIEILHKQVKEKDEK